MAAAVRQTQISELLVRIRELYAEMAEILRQEGAIVSDEAWAQIHQIDARIAKLWTEVYALEAEAVAARRRVTEPTPHRDN